MGLGVGAEVGEEVVGGMGEGLNVGVGVTDRDGVGAAVDVGVGVAVVFAAGVTLQIQVCRAERPVVVFLATAEMFQVPSTALAFV